MCEMKYFYEYNLGHRGPPNIKAEKGTIVHKVLEILAGVKLAQQNGKKTFTDDVVGRVNVMTYDLDRITKKVYEFYKKHSVNFWKPSHKPGKIEELDLRHCRAWVNEAITFNDGEFDPRNSHIIMPEQAFDFEITEPWSMYEYEMPDGTKAEGFLSLKGTIDQISKIDDNTYQILDWKTGKRINWATGEEKTYAKLCKDPQLMMYYYAIQGMYPDIDNFELVIYFINDGGPFRICFSREDIPMIEGVLRKKFEEIKNAEVPALKKTWKCSKFCHFGTTTFEGTHIEPIVEHC